MAYQNQNKGGGRPLGDYKEVADRIREFYDKYPDGALRAVQPPRLETVETLSAQGEVVRRVFLVYGAGAFKHRDNPQPDGVGYAWEPVPGATNFTRDSELMNAETSAWGRAVVAIGILAKGETIASANEVRARRGEEAPAPEPQPKSAGDAKAAEDLDGEVRETLIKSLPAEAQARDKARAAYRKAEAREKGSGFAAALAELQALHVKHCGDGCEHLQVAAPAKEAKAA